MHDGTKVVCWTDLMTSNWSASLTTRRICGAWWARAVLMNKCAPRPLQHWLLNTAILTTLLLDNARPGGQLWNAGPAHGPRRTVLDDVRTSRRSTTCSGRSWRGGA